MTNLRAPMSSQAQCPKCQGAHFITQPGQRFAVASLCDCYESCPKCQGEGYVYEEDSEGYVAAMRCGCVHLNKRIDAFNGAKLPARYHDKTLENYNPQNDSQHNAKDFLSGYCVNFRRGDKGMCLMGSVGIGKTHLMSSLLRYFTLELGVRCAFIDFFKLISELKAGFSSGQSEEQLVAPLAVVPVLAIDELGKGKTDSEWELGVLDQLISRRYNNGLTTLFTTNYFFSLYLKDDNFRIKHTMVTQQSLEDRVGPRIFSRLYDMCTLLPIEGRDFRKI
jgi:DNA replication protein DnaC